MKMQLHELESVSVAPLFVAGFELVCVFAVNFDIVGQWS